ncbi:MAG: hypothetical protein KAJ51_12130, partial [Thermoplasmata archaeon]|nr:hypothetical protein [Thermoplasmata archaeon]
DGLKSISFKVKDRAGNIANPMSTTIILNTTQTQSENVAPEKSPTNFEIWLFLSLFIIIFLIVIITGLIVIYKRNKRTEQKLILAGILPIKPGKVLGSIKPIDQVPPAINLAKLPSLVPTSDAHAQQQIAPSSSVPVLAKTTETAQESISQQTTYVQVPQELPQLPPAEIKETKPEYIETPDTSGNKS